MKKRFSIITLVVILIFSFILAVPAVAKQQVTALANGYTNVPFSNGYYGYCIDRDLHGAYTNDIFYESDTSIAKSNVDNSDISQYLKNLFVLNFELLFVSNGNGGYVLDNTKKDSTVPSAVYHFSEGQYVWGESKTVTDAAKAYAGATIPDEGHTITLSNGDVITFYFMALEPENSDQQTFFAYKIEVGQEVPTTQPEETTTLPEATTALPEETTTLPEETTTLPEETTTLPEETTTQPEESTTQPEETTTQPEETTTLPEESTTLPEESTTLPEESTTQPDDDDNSGSSSGGSSSGGSSSGSSSSGGSSSGGSTSGGSTSGGSSSGDSNNDANDSPDADDNPDSKPDADDDKTNVNEKNPNTEYKSNTYLLFVLSIMSLMGIAILKTRKEYYIFN